MLAVALVPPLQAQNARPGSARTAAIPTDALISNSRGLLYESRGDKAKASDSFQQAVTSYPDYTQARDALQRVRGG